jgi:two-component system sensor histidine kinase PilS (NtrC family)
LIAPREAEEQAGTVRRRLQWVMGVRLGVATVLLVAMLLIGGGDFGRFTPRWIQGWTALTYGVTLASALWLQRGPRLRLVAALQVVWDLLLVTALVYVSGAAGSVLSFLYGAIVLMGTLTLGPRSATVIAIAAFFLYCTMGVGVAQEWVPQPPDQEPLQYLLPGEHLGFAMLSNALGLLLVAVLAGNLAARLDVARGALKRAAESVASLERLNDDIVRSITAGLLTTDLDGRVRTLNDAGAEMFLAAAGDLIGRPASELFPLSPRPPRAGAPPLRGDAVARRPDGTSFPVGFTETPLLGPDGAVTGALVTFQDLTEVTRLREAAQHAEKLAAIGRLAAGLAHEIRNPLSSISGSVELVRDANALGEEDRKLLGLVLSEVDRLNDLVTSILTVGSPRKPVRVETDLSALAESVAAMARKGPAAAMGIGIECETPEEPVVARLDPDQVRQVLWNLVKNAVQASPQKGVVQIDVRRDRNGGAVVEVRDEGEGIAESAVPHLFEMYHSTRPHGLGLGLALVKQIVEGHGGSVTVESDRGRGATLRVTFPGGASDPPPPLP